MLAIKLKRIGKKHQGSFRLVIMEKRSKMRGASIEDLGFFNPHTDEQKIAHDRVRYWLGVGALPTPSVHNILVRIGVLNTKKVAVHSKPKKTETKTKA